MTPLTAGMRVKKWGRSSELTIGVVDYKIQMPMSISFSGQHLSGILYVKNIWAVRGDGEEAFSTGGDSGSLVVTENHSHAVGLVFAGNDKISYVLPIQAVLDAFDVQLVSGINIE